MQIAPAPGDVPFRERGAAKSGKVVAGRTSINVMVCAQARDILFEYKR
jgi:hypothetical protein